MATHGNQRTPVITPVAAGLAELRPDPARPHGWTLLVGDVPQSYVDLADPRHLAFPYIRQMVRALRAWRKAATWRTAGSGTETGCWDGADAVRPRVLHLGGGWADGAAPAGGRVAGRRAPAACWR